MERPWLLERASFIEGRTRAKFPGLGADELGGETAASGILLSLKKKLQKGVA
ncbi:hypothetical protein D3C84_1221990 [compost metagenome]